jgi:hypothetical protein
VIDVSAKPRSSSTPIPKSRSSPSRKPKERRPEPERSWDDEDRWKWIAEHAYFHSERRGFVPGFEVDDWLAAERELEQLIETPPLR